MACTQVYVIDDVNVYGILNLCTATTSTTTSTTTAAPTTTSTTTTTTTAVPTTTSTTTTTTTEEPTTTSTTTTTTTEEPTTTSTTTTTTTEEPTTTSTTTTTTTEEPTTTSTTTTTTTEVPTTTSTTTTTTTEVPTTTSTTTTTTTEVPTTTSTTTTTTTSAVFTFRVGNNNTTDGVIDSVTPAFYTITDGSIPVPANTLARGGHSNETNIVIGGFVTAQTGGGNISLYINSIFIECINMPFTGTSNAYTFAPVSFLSTDIIDIILNDGTCLPPSTTTTTTTAVPFSTFLVQTDISTATICSSALVTVYTAFGATITTGTEVFTTSSLTIPYIGADYIVDVAIGNIYAIGSGNGVIGGDTSLTC